MDPKTLNELIELKNTDIDAYGDYLFDLVKQKPEAAKALVGLYEEALFQKEDWCLKKIGIYALLFKMKKNNNAYIEEAFKSLLDKDEQSDVRIWAVTGLTTVTETGKTPKGMIESLYSIMEDKNEEVVVRDACLKGILKSSGISEREIFLKTFSSTDTKLDAEFERKKIIFDVELNKFRPKP